MIVAGAELDDRIATVYISHVTYLDCMYAKNSALVLLISWAEVDTDMAEGTYVMLVFVNENRLQGMSNYHNVFDWFDQHTFPRHRSRR